MVARRNEAPGEGRDARRRAVALVRKGELSRARRTLESPGFAPGTQDTLDQLRDPTLRPPVPVTPIPEEVAGFQPASPLLLDAGVLARALRSARRGSAPDVGGLRYEHVRVLLDDERAWEVFMTTRAHLRKVTSHHRWRMPSVSVA